MGKLLDQVKRGHQEPWQDLNWSHNPGPRTGPCPSPLWARPGFSVLLAPAVRTQGAPLPGACSTAQGDSGKHRACRCQGLSSLLRSVITGKLPLTRRPPGRADLISWLTERWQAENSVFQPFLRNPFKLCQATLGHWSRVTSRPFIHTLIDSHIHLLLLL